MQDRAPIADVCPQPRLREVTLARDARPWRPDPRQLRLAPRQRQVLEAIERSIAVRGHSPTFRELCIEFGIASTNGVGDTIRTLERKGYITRIRGAARTTRVLISSASEPSATAMEARREATARTTAARQAARRALILRALDVLGEARPFVIAAQVGMPEPIALRLLQELVRAGRVVGRYVKDASGMPRRHYSLPDPLLEGAVDHAASAAKGKCE
jgi:DNA-binding MarR family transcriptional regulator